MCLLCSNFSGFSSYLDQNKNPCMIWVLIPSTTTLLFTLLVHASLTLPSLLNILGSSLPYSLSLPDHLSLDSQHQFSLQIFTCLISMFYFLLYSACKFLLLCFVFFIIMPIILQYTIVYNLLFFSSLIYLQLSLAMLNE